MCDYIGKLVLVDLNKINHTTYLSIHQFSFTILKTIDYFSGPISMFKNTPILSCKRGEKIPNTTRFGLRSMFDAEISDADHD